MLCRRSPTSAESIGQQFINSYIAADSYRTSSSGAVRSAADTDQRQTIVRLMDVAVDQITELILRRNIAAFKECLENAARLDRTVGWRTAKQNRRGRDEG